MNKFFEKACSKEERKRRKEQKNKYKKVISKYPQGWWALEKTKEFI